MQLSLDLPQPDARLAAIVETDPRALRMWLIGLPSGQVLETGRQIFDSLASCNRTVIDADTRIKLLDEYRRVLDVMSGDFAAQAVSQGMPMRDKPRQAMLLMRNLWLELAGGYKLALVERVEKRSFFGGTTTRQVPQLVQLIMLLFYRAFQLDCRMAMPPATGMWRELHQLFQLVAQSRQLDEPKEEELGPPVGVLYKRIVLLSLADPLRFSTIELEKVIEIIDNYAPAAHFQPVAQHAGSGGFFLTRLDTDEPPSYYGANLPGDHTGPAMLIDTIELGKKLHRMLQGLETKAPGVPDRVKIQFWMDILRRLLKQWSIAPRRMFQRIPKAATVHLCVGLRNVAACAHDMEVPLPPSQLEQAGISVEPSPQAWEVQDESPGGYALSKREAPPERLRVGELVSVKPQDAGANWMYAAVRWIQQSVDGALEIGVQIFSARAELGLLQLAGAPPGSPPQAVLLLPMMSILRQPARILAPRGTFVHGGQFAVTTGSETLLLTAVRLVEQQAGFDLFEYRLPDAVVADAVPSRSAAPPSPQPLR
ncbi:hypothetical protein [Silvimonas soli]|uniref:hypothetical protein n=1 Tax=Silvimonas soli TaxID=2980100 RepID=UPI0024B321AF|nr:hypothetical protein [Silvimonas soli]